MASMGFRQQGKSHRSLAWTRESSSRASRLVLPCPTLAQSSSDFRDVRHLKREQNSEKHQGNALWKKVFVLY